MTSNNFPLPYGLALTLPPPLTPPNRTDLLDSSNHVQTARLIDQNTQDFVVSQDNLMAGMNAVNQEVLLSVTTNFNSSAVANFGQNFTAVKVITPYIKNQIKSLLAQALSYQIQTNLIVLQDVSVNSNPYGQVSLNFSYVNNTDGTTNNISYTLPGT